MSSSGQDRPGATPPMRPEVWGTPWAESTEPRASPGEPPAQVSLMQGDIRISADPKILMTVLGSCVAVCLWDKVRRAGGMNHFLVLACTDRRHGEKSTRYGDVAIDELQAGLMRLGCRMSDLQAKVFGGAAVLPFAGGQTVGSNNVRLALDRLRHDRIRIIAQRNWRKFSAGRSRFHTGTGDVFVRDIPAGIRAAGFPPGTVERTTWRRFRHLTGWQRSVRFGGRENRLPAEQEILPFRWLRQRPRPDARDPECDHARPAHLSW